MVTAFDRTRISKILIVEDDPTMLLTLSEIMRDEGFEPCACSKAEEALELVEKNDFGVAIVDLNLADASGTELLKTLNELHEKIRVIIYTGYASIDSAKDAVNQGAFAYLEKSKDPSELLRFVHKALRHQLDRYTGELEEQVRQTQKMDAIGRMAGGVAHDFNNLLSVVSAYAEILRGVDKIDLNAIHTFGTELAKAVEKGTSLTRKLLVLSRDDRCQPQTIDVNQVLLDVHKLFKRIIGEHIDFGVNVESKDYAVTIDPGHLEQVLMNLVVNARDAMPEGGSLMLESRRVTIDGFGSLPPGEYVQIIVKDTGTGMDDETIQRIYEPFFTTKQPQQGTGLGLSIVYGIVRQNNGHIQVSSRIGSGTKFDVYLPLATDEAVIEEFEWKVKFEGELNGTILLAEDDVTLRTLIRQSLEGLGLTVLEAGSGVEALDIVQQHDGVIDLLLSDVVMPKMGGPQLSDHLRQDLPDLKVIFVSGYTDELIGKNRTLGENEILIRKPISLSAVNQEVYRLLAPGT